MLRFKPQRHNQKGDTIVEVLIAVAVVSLVLAGAFATVNLSSKGIEEAQERDVATKLAAGMVERLDGDPTTYKAAPSPFCQNALLASGTNTSCTSSGTAFPYTTVVYRRVAVGVNDTYVVITTWNGPDGKPQNVILNYRMAQ